MQAIEPQSKLRQVMVLGMFFLIAEKMQAEGKEPLNDYDGPVYLRASEAEVKHNS